MATAESARGAPRSKLHTSNAGTVLRESTRAAQDANTSAAGQGIASKSASSKVPGPYKPPMAFGKPGVPVRVPAKPSERRVSAAASSASAMVSQLSKCLADYEMT